MIPRAAHVALRIWAGSRMTAMTDILLPQRGQARTSIAWTLASSRSPRWRPGTGWRPPCCGAGGQGRTPSGRGSRAGAAPGHRCARCPGRRSAARCTSFRRGQLHGELAVHQDGFGIPDLDAHLRARGRRREERVRKLPERRLPGHADPCTVPAPGGDPDALVVLLPHEAVAGP
jgi:hypothetical protein